MTDILGITRGKGFQGSVKRWGVKLLTHKNSKHRRMIGTLGPKSPGYVRPTVPQAGQMGYHQRTEYNKRILKIKINRRTKTIQRDTTTQYERKKKLNHQILRAKNKTDSLHYKC